MSDRLPLEREPKPLRQFCFCQRSKIELTNSTTGPTGPTAVSADPSTTRGRPLHDGGLEPGYWSRTNLNVKGEVGGVWWAKAANYIRGSTEGIAKLDAGLAVVPDIPRPSRSGGLAGPTFRPRWPGPTGGHPHRSSCSFSPVHGLNSCWRAWRSLPYRGSMFRCFLSRSPARPAGKWGQRSASSCRSQLPLRVR